MEEYKPRSQAKFRFFDVSLNFRLTGKFLLMLSQSDELEQNWLSINALLKSTNFYSKYRFGGGETF